MTTQTEKEMRESTAPTPETAEALAEFVRSLTEREHDYGTCVYAMSLAATAAFNHVAHKLGVTGFQASCADMDVLRRTRGMRGPFIILRGEDMLYPQYDLKLKLAEAMAEWRDWTRDEAKKLIAERGEDGAHPNVLAHWERLASQPEAA